MKVMFVHQNMPGQFGHLAKALSRRDGTSVLFATQRKDRSLHGVQKMVYSRSRPVSEHVHHYLRTQELAILNGQAMARGMMILKAKGYTPDLIIGHPGWGETLFAKDIFSKAKLINYCEYFFRADDGIVVGTEAGPALDERLRIRIENSHLLLALESCDKAWSPTEWQRSTYPEVFQSKIEVCFDGIDTQRVKPDPAGQFRSGDLFFDRNDEVVTYVARGLEPQRGFPQFARALPRVLQERPKAQIVIVGEEAAYYGAAPGPGDSWKAKACRELSLDPSRVHFVGRLSYNDYLNLLQITQLHVYLTTPFVLSWSFFEAMASECLVLASSTAPVLEVMQHGKNGLLTSLEDSNVIASDIINALAMKNTRALRENARRTIIDRYSLHTCLPKLLSMVDKTLAH